MTAPQIVDRTRHALPGGRDSLTLLAWYPVVRMGPALDYCLPPFTLLRLATAVLHFAR
jgi:hypothetical protein